MGYIFAFMFGVWCGVLLRKYYESKEYYESKGGKDDRIK